jgi:hypothetical protein
MAQCHIQWLYLAVHGCKTYLNLNLNLALMRRRDLGQQQTDRQSVSYIHWANKAHRE